MTHEFGIILNRVGLVLGMLGVLVLFVWGPPQPDFGGDKLLLEQQSGEGAAKRMLYGYASSLGLACVGIGFLLQLFSTFAP